MEYSYNPKIWLEPDNDDFKRNLISRAPFVGVHGTREWNGFSLDFQGMKKHALKDLKVNNYEKPHAEWSPCPIMCSVEPHVSKDIWI